MAALTEASPIPNEVIFLRAAQPKRRLSPRPLIKRPEEEI
jgi:hypothetical protein